MTKPKHDSFIANLHEHKFIETVDNVDIYKDRRDDDLFLCWGNGVREFVYVRPDRSGNLHFDELKEKTYLLTPAFLCRLYELFKEQEDERQA